MSDEEAQRVAAEMTDQEYPLETLRRRIALTLIQADQEAYVRGMRDGQE